MMAYKGEFYVHVHNSSWIVGTKYKNHSGYFKRRKYDDKLCLMPK